MKTLLLASAGIGGLVALVGGFAGFPILIRIGGPVMLISLILLPWLRQDAPGKAEGRWGVKSLVLGGLLLVAAPNEVLAQRLVYGDTVVEIVGLERWTPVELEDAVRRYVPGVSLASAACAVILRDSIGFADAAVSSIRYAGSDEILSVLTVIEPHRKELVSYTAESRRPIEMPESWRPLSEALAAERSAIGYFQSPEFLFTHATESNGRSAPEGAISARSLLRDRHTPADWAAASEILRASSDLQARQLAALVVSNFAERDSTWYLLVESMRSASDPGAMAAVSTFQAMARTGAYPIDWWPVEATLRFLVGGTNLFAHPFVLAGLAQTRVDPRLGKSLARRNPALLSSAAAADADFAHVPARTFLEYLGAPDFDTNRGAWAEWISAPS